MTPDQRQQLRVALSREIASRCSEFIAMGLPPTDVAVVLAAQTTSTLYLTVEPTAGAVHVTVTATKT